MILWISLCTVTLPLCDCQEISDNPRIGQSLCPGDEVILTCTTRGSSLIGWRSLDYVSRVISNQLEFSEVNSQGAMRRSLVYNSTVATLTSNSVENGVRVLVSELRIIIRPDVTSSSVICVHDNTNENTITLQLLGMFNYACIQLLHQLRL